MMRIARVRTSVLGVQNFYWKSLLEMELQQGGDDDVTTTEEK